MVTKKTKQHNNIQTPDSRYDDMNEEQLLLYLFPANLQDLRMAAKQLRHWVAPERIGTMGPDEQLIIQAFRAHLAEIEFIMDFGDEIFEIGKLYEDQTDSLRYVLQLMHGFCVYYINCRLRFTKEAGPLINAYEENNPKSQSGVVDLAMNIAIESIMNTDPHAVLKNDNTAVYESLQYILPDEATPEEIKDDFLDSIEMIQAFEKDLSDDVNWIEGQMSESESEKVALDVELDMEFFLRTLDFLQLASRIIQELNEQNNFEMVAYLLYAFAQFVFAVDAIYDDFVEDLERSLSSDDSATNFSDEVRRIIEEQWGYDEDNEQAIEPVEEKTEKQAPEKSAAKKKTNSRPARAPRRLRARKDRSEK